MKQKHTWAFKSILEFQNHFSTDDKCRDFLEQQRWGDSPCCPFCASVKVKRLKDRKRFQCNEKECRKQFSVTVGTIYENTKVPLTKWFLAMYILSNHSKGISSLQLASWLGVTQKTAWFLNHRIREMLTEKEPALLKHVIELDETYVGGLSKNKHVSKRHRKAGADGKAMVFGAAERGGRVIARVMPKADLDTLNEVLPQIAEVGSTMVTDEHNAYRKVKDNYIHHTINHRQQEYVRGDAHTNTIEGFWNILKKQITGIHHAVSPKHLQRYCNEVSYRYNHRSITQDARFAQAVKQCEGRLKYNDLLKAKAV